MKAIVTRFINAKGVRIVVAILALGLAFYFGANIGREAPAPDIRLAAPEDEHAAHDHANQAASSEVTLWTCAMHPQIQLPEPGNCPICGMELIPMTRDVYDGRDRRLVMSPAAQKLAEIQTSPVERKFVDARIRMIGKIDYDETRVKTISSYVPGRIDKLYVNYTGIPVSKGDHLALIYSPDLLTAQEELVEAKRRVAQSGKENSEFLRQSDQRALDSAREKLRLFGFGEDQIREIEKRGSAEDNMMVNAPLGGIVIHKSVNEGQYVQTGTPIYTVADLAKVWVKLEAYETDLLWLHYGQHVDLQAEAYPGEHFDGIIAFIDPVLDPDTRTVNVRVNVDNPNNRLKPGMFVHATVHARVAKSGKVMDPELAGKWISPMHPEIVRDEPGDCPICGMPLVKAEEHGYVRSDDETAKPLVVPASAVLVTGARAVVYVEISGMERPTYEGREILLGPRAGDYYIVQDGLDAGDRVVTHGNFNIDSALQIQAKPSMMSVEGQSPEEGGDIATFRIALEPVYQSYLSAQQHLALDQLDQAKEAVRSMPGLVDAVDMTLVHGDTHELWMTANRQLKRAATLLLNADTLDKARESFDIASKAVIQLEERFGHTGDFTYYQVYCPMAFDGGASWLQLSDQVHNPYFGQRMPDCGEITAQHDPHGERRLAPPTAHQH